MTKEEIGPRWRQRIAAGNRRKAKELGGNRKCITS